MAARVAKLVEQLTYFPKFKGSNPTAVLGENGNKSVIK
jgi:hypothetical protein